MAGYGFVRTNPKNDFFLGRIFLRPLPKKTHGIIFTKWDPRAFLRCRFARKKYKYGNLKNNGGNYLAKTTRSIITGITVFIVVFIQIYFYSPLSSNAILDFIIRVIILYIIILLVDVIGKKISEKKRN